MPILGIVNSGISYSVSDLGAYFPIASYVVPSGGVATVTFSSIPSTYKHLQIRATARCTATTGTTHNLNMNINSDTNSAHYNFQSLYANGTSVSYQQAGTGNYTNCVQVAQIPTSLSTTGYFGTCVIDILDYTQNVQKYKTITSLWGQDQNATIYSLGLHNYLFLVENSMVNSLTFRAGSGNLDQYTDISIYGIKG